MDLRQRVTGSSETKIIKGTLREDEKNILSQFNNLQYGCIWQALLRVGQGMEVMRFSDGG